MNGPVGDAVGTGPFVRAALLQVVVEGLGELTHPAEVGEVGVVFPDGTEVGLGPLAGSELFVGGVVAHPDDRSVLALGDGGVGGNFPLDVERVTAIPLLARLVPVDLVTVEEDELFAVFVSDLDRGVTVDGPHGFVEGGLSRLAECLFAEVLVGDVAALGSGDPVDDEESVVGCPAVVFGGGGLVVDESLGPRKAVLEPDDSPNDAGRLYAAACLRRRVTAVPATALPTAAAAITTIQTPLPPPPPEMVPPTPEGATL